MKTKYMGEVFGGLAAMLVALPSAIAYGLLIYSPLGSSRAALGVAAGITGTIILGLVAPLLGGTPRLISAPCAPAAAVLAALVAEILKPGHSSFPPEMIPILITLVALLSALLQFFFGAIGGGRLIKYIPYPVVAGYLSGVGVLIIMSQIPKFFGYSKSDGLWNGLFSPDLWKWQSLVVGITTMLVMGVAPKVTKAIPAAILALASGVLSYFCISYFDPTLTTLVGNKFVIGPFGSGGGFHLFNPFTDGQGLFALLNSQNFSLLLVPALTLAVLLSIDTLKTCVVLDALTRTRHNSNRELIGQGLGNLVSGIFGGMPGAGTMGATLVNLNSGGKTKLSGSLEGVFALLAFLIFGSFVAWVPIAALAGILLVVGFRMIDKNSFRLLMEKSTFFDFAVVAAVILTAVSIDLIAASGVGVALSILLFLRDQIRGSVIRRKAYGNQLFSKKRRLPNESALLEAKGKDTAIFELQGTLFFGTTEQLFSEVSPCLSQCKYIILDLRRVRTLDFTAAHLLEQFEAQLAEGGGCLIFTGLPKNLPGGRDLFSYFDHMGLVKPTLHVKVFGDLDEALEWTEDQALEAANILDKQDAVPLELSQIEILSGASGEDLQVLKSCVQEKSFGAGSFIFKQGESGDEICLIRKGTVKILLPLARQSNYHLATFSRGDFFGDLSFMDRSTRSANAFAATPVSLYTVSRSQFDQANLKHPRLGGMFFSQIAHTLAIRLRQTDSELKVLGD